MRGSFRAPYKSQKMEERRMKKRVIGSLLLAGVLMTSVIGCAAKTEQKQQTTAVVSESQVSESQVSENQVSENVVVTKTTESQNEVSDNEVKEDTIVRVGSLKGATSIGLLSMMNQDQQNNTKVDYEFTMATAAEEITTAFAKGELDIALVPANVASVLYQKTKGNTSVIDINTLGVLYMVSGDTQITDLSGIEGKTVYVTGKGTTPDYVLQYLIAENKLENVTIEYKAEPAEVVAILSKDPTAIGLLPQPFVTVACMKNDKLAVVSDLSKEWETLQGEAGSKLVTGVTIVRNDFLKEHENLVRAFMEEHKASAEYANANTAETAKLVVAAGIIEKEPIAMKAIPACNITYLDGAKMKDALAGYLEVLANLDKQAVGGTLPADDFYYGVN